MPVSESVIEQLEWYGQEIEKKRKLVDQKRQEFFALDSEVQHLERERGKLFRIAVNLTAADAQS